MFARKVMLAVIAGAVAISVSAFPLARKLAYKDQATVQQFVNRNADNTPGELAPAGTGGFHYPSRRTFKGLWVPILTSSLAGFVYVRVSHRSAYATARARRSPLEAQPATNCARAGRALIEV